MMPSPLNIILLLFLILGSYEKGDGVDFEATKQECEEIQKLFVKRAKIIAWEKESADTEIDSSFYYKYLAGLSEFMNRKDQRLYYHSVPDIKSDMCLVIIKRVVKDEELVFTHFEYQSSYYLIDVRKTPKVILELARFEETIDSQRRIYSEFTDDKTLVMTDIREFILDLNNANNTYQVKVDSTTFVFFINEQQFNMVKGLGTVTTKTKY